MIVGTFFGFLGILTYSLSFSFDGFLLAVLWLGIGQSFISGSDTALMYDSLAELNRSDDFIKEKIRFALSVKPKRHDFIINSDTKPYIKRHMNETGG